MCRSEPVGSGYLSEPNGSYRSEPVGSKMRSEPEGSMERVERVGGFRERVGVNFVSLCVFGGGALPFWTGSGGGSKAWSRGYCSELRLVVVDFSERY